VGRCAQCEAQVYTKRNSFPLGFRIAHLGQILAQLSITFGMAAGSINGQTAMNITKASNAWRTLFA